MLLDGQPHTHFDNLQGKLDSAVLAAARTASICSGRPLYANAVVHLPQRLNRALSGNNVEIGGDLGRRIVPIRLSPQVERPELRTDFTHPDLIRWAQSHRRELVTALLTIVQAWCAGGMHRGKETLGSYEAWAQTIGGILAAAGIPGFLQNREEALAEADSDAAGWRRVVALWHDTFGAAPVTSRQLLEMAQTRDAVPVSLFGSSGQANSTIWGRALGKQRGRIFRQFKIANAGEDTKTHDARFRLQALGEPAARAIDTAGEPQVGANGAERCSRRPCAILRWRCPANAFSAESTGSSTRLSPSPRSRRPGLDAPAAHPARGPRRPHRLLRQARPALPRRHAFHPHLAGPQGRHHRHLAPRLRRRDRPPGRPMALPPPPRRAVAEGRSAGCPWQHELAGRAR